MYFTLLLRTLEHASKKRTVLQKIVCLVTIIIIHLYFIERSVQTLLEYYYTFVI